MVRDPGYKAFVANHTRIVRWMSCSSPLWQWQRKRKKASVCGVVRSVKIKLLLIQARVEFIAYIRHVTVPSGGCKCKGSVDAGVCCSGRHLTLNSVAKSSFLLAIKSRPIFESTLRSPLLFRCPASAAVVVTCCFCPRVWR